MGLYRGNTELSKIYRGNTEIDKIYRGQTEIYTADNFPVTSGLLVRLDASNSTSYPGSGTTWYDISGNGNNATLSGATYNSGDGHYINFDGSNDQAYYSVTWPAAVSIITVGKSNGSTWNSWGGLGSNRGANGFIFHNNSGNTTISWYWRNGSNSAWVAVGGTAISNIQDWNVYAGSTNGTTSNLWYLNGSQVASNTNNVGRSSSSTKTIYLGRDNGLSRYNNLRIHAHLVYNRQLTSTEMSDINTYFANKLP